MTKEENEKRLAYLKGIVLNLPDSPGCYQYLNEEGKRIFLRTFYEKLGSTLNIKNRQCSYAELINLEIQKLVRHFRKTENYRAYRQVR